MLQPEQTLAGWHGTPHGRLVRLGLRVKWRKSYMNHVYLVTRLLRWNRER